jgi:hypothetical protein
MRRHLLSERVHVSCTVKRERDEKKNKEKKQIVFLIYTLRRFVIATKEKCDCYGSLSTMKSIIYLLFVVHNIPMGSGVYNCRHLSHTFFMSIMEFWRIVLTMSESFTARYSIVPVKDEFSNETTLTPEVYTADTDIHLRFR